MNIRTCSCRLRFIEYVYKKANKKMNTNTIMNKSEYVYVHVNVDFE